MDESYMNETIKKLTIAPDYFGYVQDAVETNRVGNKYFLSGSSLIIAEIVDAELTISVYWLLTALKQILYNPEVL